MRGVVRSPMFSLLILFAALVIYFSAASKGLFLKPKNLVNILNAMAISALLTQGVSFLMISGKLDLSTGANGTLCGMLLAFLLQHGTPVVIALPVSLALGGVIGLFNSVLVNEINFQPFIATLASTSVFTGFVYVLANKKAIDIKNPVVLWLGKGMIINYIPVSAVMALLLMVVVGVILHKTKFGRQIYLVGGNAKAAMLSGINPKKLSYKLFAICGVFSSLAGITLAARLQSGTIAGVTNARFQGITAAVLGGISFGGGSGGMGGAFVGLLVLSGFNNGMTVVGLNPYWQTVASGLLLLFALALDVFRTRRNAKA
jgi:ribose/xylose/arabinose/galactoside ABC-type transport system permease subunit